MIHNVLCEKAVITILHQSINKHASKDTTIPSIVLSGGVVTARDDAPFTNVGKYFPDNCEMFLLQILEHGNHDITTCVPQTAVVPNSFLRDKNNNKGPMICDSAIFNVVGKKDAIRIKQTGTVRS
jgi:hypothetical protein